MTDKEFTPETFAVRNAYALTMKNAHITSEGEAKAEFDRWLASVKAEAVREVADELSGEVKSVGSSGDLFTDETWTNGAMHVVVRMRSKADRIERGGDNA